MHWIEAKVAFQSANENLAVELIANLFDNLGTKGVVVDDPHMDPKEGWGDDAVACPQIPAVTGYLPVNQELEQQRQRLEHGLAVLAGQLHLEYAITYQSINEEDWAESWKAHFWPQQVTPRLVVKPSWRDYESEPGQQIIEIDPGMAFGTGTHPTTTLCMQLLEHYTEADKCVLDVGTGSGILLITAAKLGAACLAGVDIDPEAIEIARNNLERNHIAPDQYDLFCGNLVDVVHHKYHIVVANILADVILDLLDTVDRVIQPGGILICSGIIEAFQSGVVNKMTTCGFEILTIQKDEDWVAIVGRIKRPRPQDPQS